MMQIDVLLKIAGIGLLIAVIFRVLTQAGREDIAMLATVAGILTVLILVVSLAGEALTQVETVFRLP